VVAAGSVSRELRPKVNTDPRLDSEVHRDTHIVALVDVQVGVHVPLVSPPDGPGHAGPRLLEGQNTLDIVTMQLLARDRVDDGGVDTEEGERGTAGLGGGNTSKGSDDV